MLQQLVDEEVAGRQDASRASTRRSATTSSSSISRRWSTARRRSRASTRSARRAASTTSTRSCAAWWRGDDRAAALARTVLYETLIYAANRLGEIADDVVDIDRALRWGFGWERGPFETWDALGVKATAAKMEAAGYTVPGWVKEQIAAQGEGMRFYSTEGPASWASSASAAASRRCPTDPRALSLDAIRAAGGEVERNGSASILDLGDGVFCLEFHAKMNAIDPDIVAMTMKAVDRAERDGVALVIGNDAPDAFCAGANLFGLMIALGQGNMKVIDDMVVGFQGACMRTRYARVPVVAAPFGLALGGGAEVVLGCQTVRAAAELYVGCVEVGVGLIPAGGGCMEMAARASARADRRSAVRHAVARARAVPDAGDRARLDQRRGGARHRLPAPGRQRLDGARDADRRRQAAGAGAGARRLPPSPAAPHPRHRRGGAATLRQALHNLQGAHQISEHDAKVSGHLARILSGGAVPAGATVSEQHMLDLEREAFLSLCGEPKTRERIQHMLQNEQAPAELRTRPCVTSPFFRPFGPPIGRAPQRRASSNTRPDDLGALVARGGAAARRGRRRPTIEDVVLGCAHPEAEQGLNVARQVGLLAGLPDETPAMTINRFCSSGLQATAIVADRIAVGGIDVGLAGGARVDVDDPDGRRQDRRSTRRVVEQFPDAYIPMGNTAENVARQFDVSRGDQDAFALASHQKAVAAWTRGDFAAEVAAGQDARLRRRGLARRSRSTATRGRAPTRRWRSWPRSSRSSIRPAR